MIPERVKPLAEATEELARRFAAAGYSLYIVGGSVRDAILAKSPGAPSSPSSSPSSPSRSAAQAGQELYQTDIDLTTDARPEAIEEIVTPWADAVWLQGKLYGTIGCMRRSRRYEITTHRVETYRSDSRKPEVLFGDSIEVDLSRRDFTVNAMALRMPGMELIDPWGGLEDLAAGRLRTPLTPEESFSDDPLRMMRAARFIAGFGFEPVPELVAAAESLHERLAIVSPERIRDELDRLLVVPKPSPGLWFLVRTGLADEFLPELPALELEQDPIQRHKDVLAHTLAVVDKASPDRLLRLAALLHDIGKPRTRSYGPEGVSFHHHDVVGSRMARDRMKALHYSGEDIEVVSTLVELHLRFHTYRLGWSDRAVRRYVRDAGPLLERLNELTRCDCTTRNAAKARELAERMDELESRITELRSLEELDAIRPDLDGNQVMEHLGIRPGRAVGEALEFLLDLRLDEGPLGEQEAYRRLDAWWASRST